MKFEEALPELKQGKIFKRKNWKNFALAISDDDTVQRVTLDDEFWEGFTSSDNSVPAVECLDFRFDIDPEVEDVEITSEDLLAEDWQELKI